MLEVGSCARPPMPLCRQHRRVVTLVCSACARSDRRCAGFLSLRPPTLGIDTAGSGIGSQSRRISRPTLKQPLTANDLKAQALALDRIGALYFTHGNPAEALKHFRAGASDRAQARVSRPPRQRRCPTSAPQTSRWAAMKKLSMPSNRLSPSGAKSGNQDHEAATLGDIGEVFRALERSG